MLAYAADSEGVNITNSENAMLPKAEFIELITATPELLSVPHFNELLNNDSEVVVLTPDDMWTICSQGFAYVPDDYKQGPISIKYLGDGIFEITPTSLQTVTPRSGSGETTASDYRDLYHNGPNYCIRVTAYCTIWQDWVMGDTVYFTFRGGYLVGSRPPHASDSHETAMIGETKIKANTSSRTDNLTVKYWASIPRISTLLDSPLITFNFN